MRRLLGAVLVPLLLMAPSYSATTARAVQPLPVGRDFDYQLGGNAPVPANVGILARDRTASPLTGHYNICYVNGFQTQSDELGFWRHHMSLVLQHDGKPVRDQAWNEWLLDISTASKRTALATIEDRWIAGCADDGFDAVEFDNLDSYTRSHHLLTRPQARAFARLLVASAHGHGLAAGQKNLADLDGTTLGYDFAIAEECGRYDECGDYVAHYGDRVLVIEYRSQDFAKTCEEYGDELAVELRDLDLTPGGVHRWC